MSEDDATGMNDGEEKPFKELEPLKDAPAAPAHVIASIALNMAMKYHDITLVKDGILYQQYKLEGRNMPSLHLDIVFETAIKIERHLLMSSERIATMIIEAVAADNQPAAPEPDEPSP